MAADRIPRESAEEIPFPPHEWYNRDIKWLLDQPIVKKNIDGIPLNEPLAKDLAEREMINPILCTPVWWPIAGGQRLRALKHLDLDYEIRICKIEKEYWRPFWLWKDQTEAHRMVAVYFQMIELVFKSRWYSDNSQKMLDYELLGDQLKGWGKKK